MIHLPHELSVDDVEKIFSSIILTNPPPSLHQVPFSGNQSRYINAEGTSEFDHPILKRVIQELPNVFLINRIHTSNPFVFPVTVAK